MTDRSRIGYIILLIIAVTSIAVLLLMDPVVQDEAYHQFADQHTYLGIPNFWNVVSNLPFVIVGLAGFVQLDRSRPNHVLYLLLFAGITLMAFGSAYYHWRPTTDTLFWDRLPMTITFMSLFAIVISEFISIRAARFLIVPLLIIGVISVLVWRFGAQYDLRLYAWVQFFPLLALPVILLFFQSRTSSVAAYWLLFLFYAVAKILEHFDKEVYEALGFIGGHPLKHLMAAVGLYILVRSFTMRSTPILTAE